MRLAVRWRSTDPDRLVERLINALAVQPTPVTGSDAEGPGWAFDFPSARLFVVRATGDRDLGPQLGVGEIGSDWAAPATLGPDLAAVGWATVDLERTAADLGVDLAPLPADELLGAAAARTVQRAGTSPALTVPHGQVILLEPRTEGRLAAALARFGEGPAALYFVGQRSARIGSRSRIAAGPFGRQVLLPGGPTRGPYLIVGSRPLPERDAAGTMPPMMDERAIVLRGATLADAERIAALLTDEGYPAGASDIEERLAAFGSPTPAVIVAEAAGDVLGFIALHVVPRFEHGDCFVRILALVVDPGVRDRGLGHLLMAEAERVGGDVGAAFTEVTSGHHRPEARHFYESLGYDASVTTYLRKRI